MGRIHHHGNQRMLIRMNVGVRAQAFTDIARCYMGDVLTPLCIVASSSIRVRQLIEFHRFPRFRSASRVELA